ncbi:MAG: hypothetical protein AAB546_01195 [Patescibacteria group bacterium]
MVVERKEQILFSGEGTPENPFRPTAGVSIVRALEKIAQEGARITQNGGSAFVYTSEGNFQIYRYGVEDEPLYRAETSGLNDRLTDRTTAIASIAASAFTIADVMQKVGFRED